MKTKCIAIAMAFGLLSMQCKKQEKTNTEAAATGTTTSQGSQADSGYSELIHNE